jgi:two-component system, OmpR family, response regulator MtrA
MLADQSGRTRILVVEDDASIAQFMTDLLEMGGYRAFHAQNGAEARVLVEQVQPQLIILDLILPDLDGLVLCSMLKAQARAPIVVCSGTGRRRDAILSLKLGADDFVAKPFNTDDLLARIEAILRRTPAARATPAVAPAAASDELRVGSLVIENARRRVLLGGEAIQLTPTEYRLLAALAARPDVILSRDELARLVWGYSDAGNGRTIDVHVRRLRVKLGRAHTRSPSIVSVRGSGYKLVPETSTTSAA